MRYQETVQLAAFKTEKEPQLYIPCSTNSNALEVSRTSIHHIELEHEELTEFRLQW